MCFLFFFYSGGCGGGCGCCYILFSFFVVVSTHFPTERDFNLNCDQQRQVVQFRLYHSMALHFGFSCCKDGFLSFIFATSWLLCNEDVYLFVPFCIFMTIVGPWKACQIFGQTMTRLLTSLFGMWFDK